METAPTSMFANIKNNTFCLSTSPSTPRINRLGCPRETITHTCLLASGLCATTHQTHRGGQGTAGGTSQEPWLLESRHCCHSAWDVLTTAGQWSSGPFPDQFKAQTYSFIIIPNDHHSWDVTEGKSPWLSSFPKSPDKAHLLYMEALRVISVKILLRL